MERYGHSSMLVSIKEFSDFTGVKQSMLRYYDEIGLFSPIGRGENNYRYYSLSQIQTIKLIETLRSLKIPLKRIGEVMESRSPETMTDILAHYEVELNNELRKLQESFALIHTLRTFMQSDSPKDDSAIIIRFWEEKHIALGPVNDFRPDEDYHRVFSNYYRIARNLRVNLSYPIGGFFQCFDDFMNTPGQPQRYFCHDPNGLDIKRAGNFIVGFTRGDYGVLNDLPQRIQAFIDENGIKSTGPVYHDYPINEVSVKDPSQYISRVWVQID